MKKQIFPLILTVLLILPAMCVSATSNDYIILRARVNPMYIAGETVHVQAFSLLFRGNKPTDESTTLHIKVEGINLQYSYIEEANIGSGRLHTISLPALNEGHYRIIFFAQKGGLKSQYLGFEIGVTKAPIPYTCNFSPDGRKIYFTSQRLDRNGSIDKDYPFTLYISTYSHGGGETLVRTIENVTNITINTPTNHGIVIVDVVDIYGWRNSATMDLSSFSFTGWPVQYDFEYLYRDPFKSHRIYHFIEAIIGILIMFAFIYLLARWYRG